MKYTIFTAKFTYQGQQLTRSVSSNDEGYYGMATFKDGLWLDQDMKLVLDGTEHYRERQFLYIPFHRMEYITKVVIEEADGAA